MIMKRIVVWIALGTAAVACGQQVSVEELKLDNGMKVLMVPRRGDPNV